MDEIQIDRPDAETAKARLAGLPDVFRPPVGARRAVRRADVAEFRRDDVSVPATGQGLADQFLVPALPCP